jgi:hypothetical protein
LNSIRKRLECAALVEDGRGPVFLKLDDWLEAKDGSSDLWLEDSNKVGGDGLSEVNNNQLQGNGSVRLFTDSFGKTEVGETLF